MGMKPFAQPKGKLTGKQQAMIIERIKDPKASNAEIIKRAGYKAKDVHTASQQYLENMKNPEIATQLETVVDEMETVLVTTVRDYAKSDKLGERILATNTAQWIHDKVKGKAITNIKQQSTSVSLNVTLSDITK